MSLEVTEEAGFGDTDDTSGNLLEIITRQKHSNGLKLCLDAGALASYSSGQSWLDLSGNGYDFFRGTTSSSQSTDPTFNGTPGALTSSEYWSFDGGDFFQYDTSNETWMNNLHKDNALFTIAALIYPPDFGAFSGIMGTSGASASQTGIQFRIQGTTGALALVVQDGSGANALVVDSGAVVANAAAWNFLALSVNEAAGDALFYLNGVAVPVSASYDTPSSGSATHIMQIGALGNTSNSARNGTRLGALAAWEGAALGEGALGAIHSAMRERFAF